MTETIPIRVQHKRMSASDWASSTLVLLDGELGVESDTGKVKVGNGRDRFSALQYLTGPKGDRGETGPVGPKGADGVVRFEALTNQQRESLRGPQGVQGERGQQGLQGIQGPRGSTGATGPAGAQGPQGARGPAGANGEQGHSLTANVRMEGTYRNSITNNVKIFIEVYYDGQKVTDGFDLKIKHKGGNSTQWSAFFSKNYSGTGEVLQYDWGNKLQNGTPLEVIVLIEYKGMTTTASTRLENIRDGAQGPAGAPGQNIINQNGGQPMKYWHGSKVQYDAISNKDANTIYDVYEKVQL